MKNKSINNRKLKNKSGKVIIYTNSLNQFNRIFKL